MKIVKQINKQSIANEINRIFLNRKNARKGTYNHVYINNDKELVDFLKVKARVVSSFNEHCKYILIVDVGTHNVKYNIFYEDLIPPTNRNSGCDLTKFDLRRLTEFKDYIELYNYLRNEDSKKRN